MEALIDAISREENVHTVDTDYSQQYISCLIYAKLSEFVTIRSSS